MYQAAVALKNFFSGFGIPAYTQDSVPEEVTLPYITYTLPAPEWNQKASLQALIWDRTKSNSRIIQLADRIAAELGDQGKKISFTGGYLVIHPETPLVQIQVDQTNPDYRYAYLNLSINSYNLPGA